MDTTLSSLHFDLFNFLVLNATKAFLTVSLGWSIIVCTFYSNRFGRSTTYLTVGDPRRAVCVGDGN